MVFFLQYLKFILQSDGSTIHITNCNQFILNRKKKFIIDIQFDFDIHKKKNGKCVYHCKRSVVICIRLLQCKRPGFTWLINNQFSVDSICTIQLRTIDFKNKFGLRHVYCRWHRNPSASLQLLLIQFAVPFEIRVSFLFSIFLFLSLD